MKRTKHFCLIVLASALLASCATYHPRPISPATTATAFNARSLDDPGLLAFLQTNGVAAPARSDAWDLKTLTLTAFFYEPSLAEARAQLLAARAAEITAGQRPNPSLSVTPGYDSQIPGAPSPWIVPVSMDWPIETDGKRGDRVARARALSEAARWDLIAAVWRVRGQVRAALLNVFAARETAALLEAGETAQSNVVRLLTGQFEAGNVSSYEVTQAQIGLDTTRLARQAAIGQYQQARVQL
ncbi:MAG: TolC family protein, partial [Verrucomicrobia bacterium]|nr:TolC family protein [Verrucomicrobiota bacterium]